MEAGETGLRFKILLPEKSYLITKIFLDEVLKAK